MSKDRTNWNIPVSKVLDDALEHAVTMDSHSSKSEYVRDAVRRLLETQGLYPGKISYRLKNGWVEKWDR